MTTSVSSSVKSHYEKVQSLLSGKPSATESASSPFLAQATPAVPTTNTIAASGKLATVQSKIDKEIGRALDHAQRNNININVIGGYIGNSDLRETQVRSGYQSTPYATWSYNPSTKEISVTAFSHNPISTETFDASWTRGQGQTVETKYRTSSYTKNPKSPEQILTEINRTISATGSDVPKNDVHINGRYINK